ncbi:phage Gp37/Gp68 family protein [Candidatus Pacearchaeota archaeon]|nr:phage Gp37/Gp68 family protein [Candidatus Pacearchaeota archaeon]
MADTKIEWADAVWNPVTGCTKVSAGCANCYAERMSKRLGGRFGYPANEPFRVTRHLDRMDEPLKLKKPKRIFVCSMGDLFHKDMPFHSINNVVAVIRKCPQHTFLFLTKRPERLLEWRTGPLGYRHRFLSSFFPENIHLGVSVEDQATADERIPLLLQTPAAKRFVSIEPMLEPVDLKFWNPNNPQSEGEYMAAVEGVCVIGRNRPLDGVILGGETGPGARPMHPDWARKVRDDCKAAGVPFFFKQWGAYLERAEVIKKKGWRYVVDEFDRPRGSGWRTKRGETTAVRFFNADGTLSEPPESGPDTNHNYLSVLRVGKKAAGHLLDGVEHREVAE